jgi:autotransporter-associated beta strand protein
VVFNQTFDGAYCGATWGTGVLTKTGSGTLTLIGAVSTDVTVSAGRLVAAAGATLTGNATVAAGARLESSGGYVQLASLTNAGTFLGTAQIDGTLNNLAGGVVQIAAGQQISANGTGGHSNAGLIEVIGNGNVYGGGAEFDCAGPLTNAAGTGLIAARSAVLHFGGGLTNLGSLGVSFGATDVFGQIANAPGGNIAVAGGAAVTFYGDLAQNGNLAIAAAGSLPSSATVLGTYSGGGFSGGGNLSLQGNFQPSNAPGQWTFGGNLALGPVTTTTLDLSGVAADGSTAKLNITGSLALAGPLVVTNSGGLPAYNASYRLLEWRALSGQFASVSLPVLGHGLGWDASGLYTAGTIAVLPNRWNLAGGGTWNSTTNWTGAYVPNGSDDTAAFLGTITAPATVSVDSPVTAGTLVFDSSCAYTLAGPGAITMQASNSGPSIDVQAGSHFISAPLVLAGNLAINDSGSLTLSGGVSDGGTGESMTLSGPGTLVLSGSNNYSGGTTVEGGTLEVLGSAAIADGTSLTVGTGGAFAAAPSPAASAGEAVAAVPEPATLLLLAAAAVLGLLFKVKRKR